ncbi:MAG: acyltransferase [Candidatus Omnitrophota bacterium]|nr:acyltransferase [Candidatus Omnitrophota bacterium]
MPRMIARIRAACAEVVAWTEGWLSGLPGITGRRARGWYYGRRLAHLGPSAYISTGVEFIAPERIRIGERFTALRYCLLCASGGGRIEIGNDVSLANNAVINAAHQGFIAIGHHCGIANNCVLRTSPYRYDDPDRPFKTQGHVPGTIVLEEDVWLTVNSVLLPGTYLERGCVVCPGSVVSGRVKAYSVVAGNPARVIGRRGIS